MAEIGDFVHELREFLQLWERSGGDATTAQFELHGGDHADQVAISRAFSVAVDGSLDVVGPGFEGGDAVGDAESAIVVGVDADTCIQLAAGVGDDAADFAGDPSAVGFAEADDVGPRLFRRLPRGEGVLRSVEESIETVFSVVHHGLPVILQISYGVGDHGQILIRFHAQDLQYVQEPGLAHDGDHGGLGVEQHADLVVVFDRNPLLPGEAEGGDLGILPLPATGLLEEFEILGIGTRPTTFDVMHPKLIQLLRNPKLVGQGKVDAFTLGSVAEGGVVDFNLLGRFHVELGKQKTPFRPRNGVSLETRSAPETGNNRNSNAQAHRSRGVRGGRRTDDGRAGNHFGWRGSLVIFRVSAMFKFFCLRKELFLAPFLLAFRAA